MPLSRYLKIWPCRTSPGYFILYSTKKGSTLRLSAVLLEAAQNGAPQEDSLALLRRHEIWVDALELERNSLLNIISSANDKAISFHTQLVLNLDCNLACPYCYEEQFRHKQYMPQDVADLFVEKMITGKINNGIDLVVDFYGGEPLLSLKLLINVATRLSEAAKRAGTKFSCYLFTNGTLLTRKVVIELLPLGLTGALITLDGPRQIHDRQRPFVSGKGSFDTIVANVKEICDLIDIEIGGNYNAAIYREFPALLDYLLAEGITPEKIKKVQFSPISEKSSPVSVSSRQGSCAVTCNRTMIDAVPFLRAETIKRGFNSFKPKPGACVVEFDNFLVVNFDGTLYKCPAFMGWPELSIGTLADGVKDYSESHRLGDWQNDECMECAYLPLCFGGCRLNPLLNNGSINELDCRREFFDATLEKLILQSLHMKTTI